MKKKKVRNSSPMVRISKKRTTLSVGEVHNLTSVEKEVLAYLKDDFLTTKQISLRRGTTPRNTQKIIQSIKQKGALSFGSPTVRKNGSAGELTQQNGIRINGEKIHIKIIWRNNSYKDKIGTQIELDGNTIRLYKKAIMIFSTQSFFGTTTQDATFKSMEYWNRFIHRLQDHLKLILIKPRSENITMVQNEYAHIRNGLAIDCEKKGTRIKIRTKDDGKVFFEIDNSFNLHEAEFKHPKTAMDDSQKFEPFFNDLRDKESYVPSELSACMKDTTAQINQMSHALTAIANYLKSNLPQSNMELPPTKEKPIYWG